MDDKPAPPDDGVTIMLRDVPYKLEVDPDLCPRAAYPIPGWRANTKHPQENGRTLQKKCIGACTMILVSAVVNSQGTVPAERHLS